MLRLPFAFLVTTASATNKKFEHDVIELGLREWRKSLFSQPFRPWTVGTMDCPNVLNRLVGTIVPTFEHTLIDDVNPSRSLLCRSKTDSSRGASKQRSPPRTYYDYLLGTIVPSRIVT